MLQLLEISHAEFESAAQHLGDALGAEWSRELEVEWDGISRRPDVVIRRDDESARRIERARQLLGRTKAAPLIAASARHRQKTGP